MIAFALPMHSTAVAADWIKSEYVERGHTDVEVAEYAPLNANFCYPDPERVRTLTRSADAVA